MNNISVSEYKELIKKRSKYGNKKVPFDGYVFDSIEECEMYKNIKLAVKAKEMILLGVHVPFTIFPAYTRADGVKVRKITYEADFLIVDIKKAYKIRIIDCKGMKTDVFKLKEKLFNSSLLPVGKVLEYTL